LPLSPNWDPTGYEVQQWGIATMPGSTSTLRVRASVTNRAGFPQPYPLLRLSLEDLWGAEVGVRALEPAEYLPPGTSPERMMRKLYESTSAWDKLAALVARDAELADAVEQKVKLWRQAARIQAEKRTDHAAAAALLDRAAQVKPDDRELLLELCDAYNASGRGKAAAEVLEKIVQSFGNKRTKDLAEIHRRLAGSYLADGNGQRALEELDKAFRIEPGNIGVLSALGEVAIQVGDFKKAQQMYRALLLQKLDDNGPIKKALVFVRLGDIHDKLGEKPKAQQMYERALQTDAKLEEAKTKLAVLKG
jgi:tetratricopeptide (TPR) repeat protein